jgi:methionyl-tRNA formyltransferase
MAGPRALLGLARPLALAPAVGVASTAQPDRLKVMFFGTDEFAVRSLEQLHRESQAAGGSVGRLDVTVLPMRGLTPAVTRFAEERGLGLHSWPLRPDTVAQGGFHLGVVASFGRLLPAALISAFPLGIINMHGSLLPRWRGAAPVITRSPPGIQRPVSPS